MSIDSIKMRPAGHAGLHKVTKRLTLVLLIAATLAGTQHAAAAPDGHVAAKKEPVKTESQGTHVVDSGRVLTKLSKRSGLDEKELGEMLAHCDDNQQNTGLCAQRDAIAEHMRLQALRDAKVRAAPRCAATFDADLRRWQTQRERTCAKVAAEHAGGSIEGTMLNQCLAEALTKDCTRLQQHRCK